MGISSLIFFFTIIPDEPAVGLGLLCVDEGSTKLGSCMFESNIIRGNDGTSMHLGI